MHSNTSKAEAAEMDIKQECHSSDSYDSFENIAKSELCFESDVKSEPFATVFLEEPYSCIEDEGVKEELDIKEEPTSPFDHLEAEIYTKPLTCYVCDFTTTHKCIYNAHMATHSVSTAQKHMDGSSNTSKEKLFDCSYCSFKFTSRGSLRRHLKSNNSGAMLACNLCDYKFNSKCMLKFHMEKMHLCSKPMVRAKGLSDASSEKAPVELSLIGLIIPKSPVKDKLSGLPDDTDYSIAYLLFQIPRVAAS